ncbi:MAG: ACT domain-containing protein [Acidimicrobiales bacterium]
MSGETDLDSMLATLSVSRRAETYAVVHVDGVPDQSEAPVVGDGIEALVVESEGLTVVCTLGVALDRGWRVDFEAAWLTLDVHSALEAVGLTAAFSTALGSAGIPCNVLAGFFHDHLLVPVDRADDAIACLEGLRER